METACVQCGKGTADVGLLCSECAAKLTGCDGLLPDHITSRTDAARAAAWLIDQWGHPHAVPARESVVGRMPGHDLKILNGSVSRDHARLVRENGTWMVRDLGSRNWTQVDGVRVEGRAALADGAHVTFGAASFFFKESSPEITEITRMPAPTGHAADSRTFRFTLHGETVAMELCLLGTRSGDGTLDATGALLYRDRAAEEWSELNLSSLEFQLLNLLCRQWLEENGSESKTRGCVATKRLAKTLPFQSRYANEENVRQVVRRTRTTLKKIGVDDLIGAVPGRGYHLAWPVASK
jgi:pSer/pThr/pTyr-binding forkhead associated (FHA) protein